MTSLWGPYALWIDRVVGRLIDYFVLAVAGILLFLIGTIFSDFLAGLVYGLGGLAVFLYEPVLLGVMEGRTGQTPGKRFAGMKTVKESNGQALGPIAGVVRRFLHFLDSLLCFLGYLFPLWDQKRQTFADMIMSTVVIKGLPPRKFGAGLYRP